MASEPTEQPASTYRAGPHARATGPDARAAGPHARARRTHPVRRMGPQPGG
jgi:hypothetical protein